ncbi:hypothetical protein Y032_0230g2969 [Ancylostoma ceylanicum]|uniref:Peptidase S1 domain-containing protein n=1 Tax=Ancylostoma ceylanicum TaxID=53326 RepID=A0A016SGX3_9BILA|nr:hypothetical protein Y032_0230g2969 [Ancylostoma ceylanicum]
MWNYFSASLPKTLTDPGQYSRGKQVVAQKLYGVDDTSHMIATVTFSKSPQPGDSGGPLFQVDESETHTLVGITSLAVVGYAWKPDIGESESIIVSSNSLLITISLTNLCQFCDRNVPSRGLDLYTHIQTVR